MNDDNYRDLKNHVDGLKVHEHICMVYHDREQQVTAITTFIHRGLKLGEKCVYIADKLTSNFVVSILNQTGLDTDELMAMGVLEIVRPEDVYIQDGIFKPRQRDPIRPSYDS